MMMAFYCYHEVLWQWQKPQRFTIAGYGALFLPWTPHDFEAGQWSKTLQEQRSAVYGSYLGFPITVS
jgi:hypothetical protein